MKLLLKILLGLVVLVVVVGVGAYVWAGGKASSVLAQTVTTHTVSFPIPFPLDSAEIRALKVDSARAAAIAVERATERGRHLMQARYACIECHGTDLSGGVMIDSPVIGEMRGPNITMGRGSRTLAYGPADWDRAVRHGVKPDGTPSVMPSEDFQLMSDRELSDIVTYIRAQPPVPNEVAPVKLGPLGKVLLATGQMKPSATIISAHDAPHLVEPPAAAPTVEFGKHLAATCTGCHRADLGGGPIIGGDPSWLPAKNLTPHAAALGGWTYEQFVVAMREGKRPDGTMLQPPMSVVIPYTKKMTDVEAQALWAYLQSVPAVAPRQ